MLGVLLVILGDNVPSSAIGYRKMPVSWWIYERVQIATPEPPPRSTQGWRDSERTEKPWQA